MFLARVLFGVLTTWCTISAITVPVDRADVQLTPTRPSMIANGWRPLTGYENIGTNVSPSSTLERNGPHHPVLGKLHEHMHQSGSEKLKPQTKNQKPQEYTPPSILGSFSVFGHAATKSRPKPKEYPKQSTAATTHYSFLVPPPRDSFRFEIDPNRKTMLRDNEQFLRQPTFISQSHQSDVNPSPFFSKGSGFTSSTTHSPSFSKGRPFVINGFGVQQPIHNLRHNQPQQFELQKASNTKSYFQPPGPENAHNFNREANSDAVNFGRYQNHPHSSQIPNGGPSNFYSQVDHPPPFKGGSYERDPSFLVHESHEISYVTPSSNFGYNFRPSLQPYNNLVPPNLFSSTSSPKVESNKFAPSQSGGVRNDHYKQFGLNGPNGPEDSLIKAQALTHALPAGTYYLQGEQRPATSWPQQKSKFTTEINEVLPRKNPPAKFRQESARPNPAFGNPPEVVFIRPNGQQQFENPISSGQVHQTTPSEPEYETPESISLKHFNEQQFLLQQQLVQQDRQRLQEQELQRQREQQRKQEEEVRKRQEEIRLFEQREKEAQQKKQEEEAKQQQQQQQQQQQRKEQQQAEHEQQKLQAEFELRTHQQMQDQIDQRKQQEAHEELEKRQQEQLRQQLEEQKRLHEQQFAVQQQEYSRPVAGQDGNPAEQVFQTPQEAFESTVASAEHESKKTSEQPAQQEEQPQTEPEVRPYRPKFPQRGPNRRRRPLNPTHGAQVTEPTVQDVGTYHSVTETSPQTTVEPEVTTVPVPVTLRPRNRRPTGQSSKRRRPFSTTTTPQYESSSVTSSSIREPETSSRYQTLDTDFAKRRRARPTQATVVTEETATERHLIRKRPSGHRQRVNPGEPFEAEVVTEIVRPTRIIYKDTTEWENYPETFKKKDSQEIDTSSLPSQTLAFSQDMEQVSTENGQVFEFSTEAFEPEEITGYEQQVRTNRPTQSYDDGSNIPLEQLFDKPEENHVEPATTPEDFLVEETTPTTTTTTSTTTTTQIPTTTTTEVTSTTRQSHRIRPLKYGNATRPRFSIKDYKSRLDYKNRLSQVSTTEGSPVVAPGRRRTTTEKPEDSSPGSVLRDTTSRYKYMSRVAYKPTTSSPATSPEETNEETTTERVNRFMPKRKFNMNLYRSRVSATTPQSGSKLGHEDNRQSTTRPENIYSSAIRRPRPSYRNRNQQPEDTQTEGATEMAAEETSFYSAMTTPRLKEISEKTGTKEDDEEKETPSAKESTANEVSRNEEVGLGDKVEDASGVQVPEEDDGSAPTGSSSSPTRRMQENQQDDDAVSQNESAPTLPAWTEPSRDAEDVLISQRIANLTSSASELHEPGMFKAVSPATESRVISPHFAIATDEPTLPIEAFFQVLAKKDE